MAKRSMWKGSLSFGLVNIPVEMYVASKEHELKFVLLHDKDYSQVRYARICKEEDKEIPWAHIVKGFETEKGHLVVMTDEDFSKAHLPRTDTIDIMQFADESEVLSLYFEKPYYLTPQKASAQAYALLLAALKKTNKVGIATYVLHNRGHVGVIKPYENILLMNQLRYSDEVVSIKDITTLKSRKSSEEEPTMALKLIEQMTKNFDISAFKDNYSDKLKKLIKQKSKGKIIEKTVDNEPLTTAKVYDIMSALKAILKEKKKRA